MLFASALASTASTVVSNPLEVAKLNMQFFPLSCQYYPHQSRHPGIQIIANFLAVAARASTSKGPSKVSK